MDNQALQQRQWGNYISLDQLHPRTTAAQMGMLVLKAEMGIIIGMGLDEKRAEVAAEVVVRGLHLLAQLVEEDLLVEVAVKERMHQQLLVMVENRKPQMAKVIARVMPEAHMAPRVGQEPSMSHQRQLSMSVGQNCLHPRIKPRNTLLFSMSMEDLFPRPPTWPRRHWVAPCPIAFLHQQKTGARSWDGLQMCLGQLCGMAQMALRT